MQYSKDFRMAIFDIFLNFKIYFLSNNQDKVLIKYLKNDTSFSCDYLGICKSKCMRQHQSNKKSSS